MLLLREMFDTLREYYEHRPVQEWWPDDPLEVIFGAVLVPGTKWANVAPVLAEFKAAGLLDFQRLLEMGIEELQERIRPVGFQPRKAKTLRGLLEMLQEECGGNLAVYFQRDTEAIRSQLLRLFGIGEATADNILLYAGNRGIYSVDKLTRRILLRHGLIGTRTKDPEIQRMIADAFSGDADLFSDFQALFVRIGRDFCEKSNPKCLECPLRSFLPEGGPRECRFESAAEPALRQRKPAASRSRNASPRPTGGLVEPTAPAEPAATAGPKPIPADVVLSDLERKVLELVQGNSTPIDTVIQESDFPTGQVLATLAALEMRRLIRRREGNNVARC